MTNNKMTKDGGTRSDSVFQYFEALQRLVEGRPSRVPIGTAITLNAVALEAGKSAGSIKKQRPVYGELIKEVMRLAAEQKLRAQPDMTCMVRQMQATAQGIPLEIYCFTRTTAWADYERIQGDIFDYLLAVMPEFGLSLYQQPSGMDFRAGWTGK
nr:mechanosensitive ion channel domain-containing protein [Pseudomonas sp. UMAB-08]